MLIDFDKSPSHVLRKNSKARGFGEAGGNWHKVGQIIEKLVGGMLPFDLSVLPVPSVASAHTRGYVSQQYEFSTSPRHFCY